MRCPSWSPGNELKCTQQRGHEGRCTAFRPSCGDKIRWKYRFYEPPIYLHPLKPLPLTPIPGLKSLLEALDKEFPNA